MFRRCRYLRACLRAFAREHVRPDCGYLLPDECILEGAWRNLDYCHEGHVSDLNLSGTSSCIIAANLIFILHFTLIYKG